MKYMLMMYFEENGALTQEQREHCYVESTAFANKLHESGKFLGAAPSNPLPRPPASACKTAAPRDRRPLRGNPRAARRLLSD